MSDDEQLQEALSRVGDRDHIGTREYRIFGPPGTGKTTNLSGQIHRAVRRFGPDSVLVTSFSRAAAKELAGRDLPIDDSRIGTLHSHCWRALGRPSIAEVNAADWNKTYPRYAITHLDRTRKLEGEQAEEDAADSEKRGDVLLSALNCARGTLQPQTEWGTELRDFANRWKEYKRSNVLLDFCDLIHYAASDVAVPPFKPAVLFVDEATVTLNRLQMNVVRQWGNKIEYFIIAADDDQTIYSWCGASPDVILEPEIPPEHKDLLEEKRRVPRLIHARAMALARQLSRRQSKEYDPRDEDGAVRLVNAHYKSPENSLLAALMRHLEKGQSVMVLARVLTCCNPPSRFSGSGAFRSTIRIAFRTDTGTHCDSDRRTPLRAAPGL